MVKKQQTPAQFLRQRGLPRDKANYVMAVIRMRAEVRHLMHTATDPDVVDEVLVLDSFLEDSITTMYQIEGHVTPSATPPKGAA